MRNMNRLPYSRDNMPSLPCTCGNGENAALQAKMARELQGDRNAVVWPNDVASEGLQLFNRLNAVVVFPSANTSLSRRRRRICFKISQNRNTATMAGNRPERKGPRYPLEASASGARLKAHHVRWRMAWLRPVNAR